MFNQTVCKFLDNDLWIKTEIDPRDYADFSTFTIGDCEGDSIVLDVTANIELLIVELRAFLDRDEENYSKEEDDIPF